MLFIPKLGRERVLSPDGIDAVVGHGGHPRVELVRGSHTFERVALGSLALQQGKVPLESRTYLEEDRKKYFSKLIIDVPQLFF